MLQYDHDLQIGPCNIARGENPQMYDVNGKCFSFVFFNYLLIQNKTDLMFTYNKTYFT